MITQAAILDLSGKIWTLPQPNRHGQIINLIVEENVGSLKNSKMGFVDENGKFYDRKEAWSHAVESKQLFYIYNPMDESKRFVDLNPKKTGGLCSEDLW